MDNLPMQLEMDYSRILNKPYFVRNIRWDVTDVVDTQLSSINIPGDILINELAKIPFKASVYYRAKIKAIVQTSGTPMHQGCLIVSALPAGFPNYNRPEFIRNTLMCCPHTFLLANEATPGTIEIPFYVQGKLAAIDLLGTTVSPATQSDDYARLVMQVWNPLGVPSSGSTTLSVSVHFMFTDLEFYVPHVDVEWTPFVGQGLIDSLKSSATRAIDGIFSVGRRFTSDLYDTLRSGIKQWTGLHNPEYAQLQSRTAVQYRQNLNLVDTPSYFEKLDPYSTFTHITNDYTFDTNIDEMSLAYILKKPQFIGSFDVNTNDVSGKLLWSRPITPIQEVNDGFYRDYAGVTQYSNSHTNMIQTLALLSKYWKGGLKLHIQAVMSNFHYCRLVVARDYSPDTNMASATPNYASVTNLLTETLEFSAGGQIQSIELPFCSPLNQLPCSSDFIFNALEHGMYYIYLYQPLVANGSVPKTVNFNVYLSCGDDFDFFGYAVQPLITVDGYVSSPITFNLEEERADRDDEINLKSPMTFLAQAAVTVDVSDQKDITNSGEVNDIDTMYDLRPIKSIRDYTRRLHKVFASKIPQSEFVAANGTFEFSVAQLLGLDPTVVSSAADYAHNISTLSLLSRLFLGYSGGLKVKVLINGSTISEVWYVPPSYAINRTNTFWEGTDALPPNTNALYDPISQMFNFPARLAPTTTYSPFYSVQTVSTERPNYINHMPGFRMKAEQAGVGISMATSITEFTIPYMSPYRFVGDYTKWGCTDSPNVLKISTHEMGTIVLKVASPVNITNVSAPYLDDISIEIYAATTDEGRFGYQVAAPPVILPAITSGSPPNQLSYQLTPSWNLSTSKLPFSTVSSSPTSPGLYTIRACYYSST
jgi:hypothetical protein